jgi:hypothetical protein
MIQPTRRSPAISGWTRAVFLLIALLVMAGCGDSNNDFVVTGNNNPNPGAGSLTFQFVKAQAATVPQSTTDIRFDYLDGDADVIDTEIFDFATSITVFPPVGTAAVRITALDANGFPMLQLQGAASRPPNGTNVLVDLATFTLTDISFDSLTVTPDPTEVTAGVQQGNTQQLTVTAGFSNGQNIVFNNTLLGLTEFDDNGSTFYTVSATGLVTAAVAGDSTLTASFTDSEGTERTDTIDVSVTGGVTPDVLVVTPDTLNIPIGGTSTAVTATLNGAAIANNLLTFSIVDNTAGFTANADGTVSVDGSVVDGTPATLRVALTSDLTVTDTVAITAMNPTVVGRQFSLPSADVTLPWNINFGLQVSETFDNGQTVVVADPVAAGYSFSLNNNSAAASVNAAGVVSTGTTDGTADVDLIFNAETVDSFVLTVDQTEVPSGITVTPNTFQLTPGETTTYTVVADFADAPGLDVTTSSAVTFTPDNNGGDSSFDAGTATGGSFRDSDNWTVDLNGTTTSINVDVALGFITSLDITIGGQSSGNIPFLLDGVVEVTANFLDGRSQALLPSQFTVIFDDADNDVFTINGNVLEADAGNNMASVGSSEVFRVNVNGSDYPWANNVDPNVPFTATYVTNAGGSATVGFRHYPTNNAIFFAPGGAGNRIPRALNVLFSNGAVTDFRVADNNLVENAGFYTFDPDIWGYPGIYNSSGTGDLGTSASSTVEVRDDNGNLVVSGVLAPVRVLTRHNSGLFIGSANLGCRFLPDPQAVSVGGSFSASFEFDARPGLNQIESFDLTEEFIFEADFPYFLRVTKANGQLSVSGLSTAGMASQNVDIDPFTIFDSPVTNGGDLDVTVNQ